jgi:chemotaxis-related protein WspB
MLLLRFQLGELRFALEARQIAEVIPLVALEPVPRSPRFVAGLVNYRAQLVPVIDLCELIQQRPCTQTMTSRVLLVDYPLSEEKTRLLGLMAEQVTETFKCKPDALGPSGVRVPETPYLSRVLRDGTGVIHLVELEALLPDRVQQLLFHQDAA